MGIQPLCRWSKLKASGERAVLQHAAPSVRISFYFAAAFPPHVRWLLKCETRPTAVIEAAQSPNRDRTRTTRGPTMRTTSPLLALLSLVTLTSRFVLAEDSEKPVDDLDLVKLL